MHQSDRVNVFRADFEVVEWDPKLTLHSESEIVHETASDPTLSGLYRIISEGWPECRDNTPLALRPYWGYRDEPFINNRAIYKGLAVLVHPYMVKHMLERIHANHLGVGLITDWLEMCCFGQACERPSKTPVHARAQQLQRSPSIIAHTNMGMGHIVSQDLFSFEKEDYLVPVCHFSD